MYLVFSFEGHKQPSLVREIHAVGEDFEEKPFAVAQLDRGAATVRAKARKALQQIVCLIVLESAFVFEVMGVCDRGM